MEVDAAPDAEKNEHDDPGRVALIVPAVAFNWQFMSRLMRSFVRICDMDGPIRPVPSRPVRTATCAG